MRLHYVDSYALLTKAHVGLVGNSYFQQFLIKKNEPKENWNSKERVTTTYISFKYKICIPCNLVYLIIVFIVIIICIGLYFSLNGVFNWPCRYIITCGGFLSRCCLFLCLMMGCRVSRKDMREKYEKKWSRELYKVQ